jgi:hypothetical protein
MSAPGQKAKYSRRANVVRCCPDNRHTATTAPCPFGAKPGSRCSRSITSSALPLGATLHPGGRSVSTTCGLLHKNSVRIEVCECGVVGLKMAYEHANGTRAISAGTAGRRCAASGAASACWRTPKRSAPTGRWAALAASKGYGCASQGPHGSWSFDRSSTRQRNAKLRRVALVIAASSRIHGPKVLC